MKTVLLAACFLFCFSEVSSACDISIKTEGTSGRKTFSKGEQVVVQVLVKHIHRVCRLDIEDTTIEAKGLKVVKTTVWKESSPGLWVQTLTMKVSGERGTKLRIQVSRECSRGVHEAELVLESV